MRFEIYPEPGPTGEFPPDIDEVTVLAYDDLGSLMYKKHLEPILDPETILGPLLQDAYVNLDNAYVSAYAATAFRQVPESFSYAISAVSACMVQGNFEKNHFKGMFDFTGTLFMDGVSFESSVISCPVEMEGCVFTGFSNFMNTHFHEDVYMEECLFLEDISMAEAHIKKRLIAHDCQFEKELDMSFLVGYQLELPRSMIASKYTLSYLQVEAMLDLEHTRFKEDLIFDQCKIEEALLLSDLHVEGSLVITLVESEKIDLSEGYVEGDFRINTLRRPLKVKEMNFLHLHIGGIFTADWDLHGLRNLIYEQGYITTYREKADQFILLKNQYNKQGRFDEEDKAYFEFKRSMRLSCVEERKERYYVNKTFKHYVSYMVHKGPLNLIKRVALENIGGYGTKPVNVLFTMVVVIVSFGCLYYILPYATFSYSDLLGNWAINQRSLSSLFDSVYYSGITFLTIGYGDIHPVSILAKSMSVLEGFLGIFLMSYFTVAYVRKLLR